MDGKTLDCKRLLYHPSRQEVITPVRPNRLLRWDVAGEPQLVDELQLGFSWREVPQMARLPEGLAIARSDGDRSYIDLHRWDDWQVVRSIPLQHLAYEEVGLDDERCGHDVEPEIGYLGVTPDGCYLVAAEGFGDVQLLDWRRGQLAHRLRRRWTDYTGWVQFEPQMAYFLVETTDQFSQFELYRLDDLVGDGLTALGGFFGDMRCHRDRLYFSPDGTGLVHSSYHFEKQATLTYRRLSRGAIASSAANEEIQRNELPRRISQMLWERNFPYIQHDHGLYDPWQSDVAFLDEKTWVYGAGCRVAEIAVETGDVVAEYPTADVVQALVVDRWRDRILLGLRSGLGVMWRSSRS